MRDKGMAEEAIAAAFFVSVTVVKQRLRLTSVSPTLLEIYADDGMTLEQLMAFTVSPDHARQESICDIGFQPGSRHSGPDVTALPTRRQRQPWCQWCQPRRVAARLRT